LRRPIEFAQYTSVDYTQTLTDHSVLASVGSVGDAYDNAMAESFVDSFKTELIADRVWRTRSQLELAVVEYVGWFNHSRLHEALGDRPPGEFEALHAAAGPISGDRSVEATSARAAERLSAPRLSPTGPSTASNGAKPAPRNQTAAPLALRARCARRRQRPQHAHVNHRTHIIRSRRSRSGSGCAGELCPAPQYWWRPSVRVVD